MTSRRSARTFVLTLLVFASAVSRVGAGQTVPPDGAKNPALALAALDRKIADLDTEDDASKKELAGLGGKLAEAHLHAVLRGRAFYKLTRAGMLPVGGGFDALVRHAMQVERSRHALIADLATERKIRSRGAELAASLERVAHDRIALASQRTATDAAQMAVADEARRQAAFDRAFESTGGGDEYVNVYGGSGTGDRESVGGFQASRGKLLFPVVGRAEVKAAKREGTEGPGVEIRAPLGSPVRSVFAGRVAFADRYGSYGRIVILDHGDHYYSVSGNLASVDVKVGDDIPVGEKIGTVGDEGQGALLYFEIRHGSQTIAPAPWLGL
ncbi:MAG: peptidoglycan DD-metalloendopeptidase family protein [Polyangiaceae bacterium]